TARGELDVAVECMRKGAFDYLVKPVEMDRFESSVKRALDLSALRSEISSLKKRLLMGEVEHSDAFSSIVTVSRKMRAIFQYVEVIAVSNQPVLITGETGVGKELVARAVHEVSGRPGAYVAVSVAGLDDTMFSDTLFGHKKGAFTGANEAREGLVATAAGGTLFLDEIGDMSGASQVKLLRLLQEQSYYPLGSDLLKRSDVRVVVATNHDLGELMAAGAFRKDLYYRLFAHHIAIPPLRERMEDVPVLLGHFLDQSAREMGKKRPTPTPELAKLLMAYHFPGNVRELQAMVYDAVARHSGGVLSMESFREVIGKGREARTPPAPLTPDAGPFGELAPENFPTLKDSEERLISKAMELAGGNQGVAAGLLGLTRQALNKRLKRREPG
ncbi:MAG: sigma-54-dependent transcriptional regulator, partial [Thermodesulfobacteriota bacterium]